MELREAVDRVRYELYKTEGFSDEDLRIEPPAPGTMEYARYIDRRSELSEKRTPEIARDWRDRLEGALQIFGRSVPEASGELFSAPVIDLMREPGRVVEEMSKRFFGNPLLFDRVRGKIRENAGRMGNRRPSECDDPLAYFAGTPLRWLFEAHVPAGIPEERRFEGMWIVGRQGAGKTNLLSAMILRDLDRVARGEACVVVIDVTGSQPGQLVHNVISHKRFAPGGDLHGKLLYVDPTDREVIPINLMSVRADAGDADAVSNATAKFLFLMGGLMGQPLTTFQEPIFRAAVQLAMVMPNPTLATLRDIIRPRSDAYRPYLPKLRPALRDFFEHVYNDERATSSRREISTRLASLSMDPKFGRLFEHQETRLDFSVEMNRPKVIVINCDRNDLKSMTKLFGRFYFGLITAAAEARASIPRSRRLPTYLYFDEASEIVGDDPNVSQMIYKLRQMNIGLILGMQDTSQAKGEVGRACASAVIKLANCNSESARDLARDMGCEKEPHRLTDLPRGQFAMHISGATPRPITVRVPRVVNDRGWKDEPHMTRSEFEQVMQELRAEYYVPEPRPKPAKPEPGTDPEPEAEPKDRPKKGGFGKPTTNF